MAEEASNALQLRAAGAEKIRVTSTGEIWVRDENGVLQNTGVTLRPTLAGMSSMEATIRVAHALAMALVEQNAAKTVASKS